MESWLLDEMGYWRFTMLVIIDPFAGYASGADYYRSKPTFDYKLDTPAQLIVNGNVC